MKIKSLFVLGPQRTGTTWIYRQLCLQPSGIFIDRVIKESNIFLNSWQSSEHYDYLVRNTTGLGSPVLVADVCSVYAGVPGTIERILSAFPEAKFVWIRRNPVERLQSLSTHHEVNYYGRNSLGFTLSSELGHLQSDLESWSSQLRLEFPDQTLELDFRDLQNQPQIWLEKISEFVDIELSYFNTGVVNKSRGESTKAKRMLYGLARPIQASPQVEQLRRLNFRRKNPTFNSFNDATKADAI